jgi:uncharacterized membrane protein YbhN (UPF0104 family)
VAANLLSLSTHAARWRAVMRAPGGHVRYRDALVALLAGFAAGLVLPGRGGDVLRSHVLARRAGIATTTAIAAAALDYLVGTVAFVAALAAVAAAAPLPGWGLRALAVTAALAAAGAAGAWLLRPPRAASAGEGRGVGARLRAGLAAVHDRPALARSFGWALAGWAAEGAVALATLAALGLPVALAPAALAVLGASAAAAVAVAPGNAGSFELATALAVSGSGVPAHSALAFALAFHAVHVVPVAILGGLALLREGIALRAARE